MKTSSRSLLSVLTLLSPAAWFVSSLVVVPVVKAGGHHNEGAQDADEEAVVYPEPVTTRHSIEVLGADGETVSIHFEATVGTMTLHDEGDERTPVADVFTIAYHKLEPAGRNDDGTMRFERPEAVGRPITFSFNGGPGSSSVWLHLGVFGPFMPTYGDDFGNPGPPPYPPVENPHSAFELSDFVFIDPVRTGFSRARPGVDEDRFHSVDGDINSVSDVIYRYLAEHDRFTSPVYIAGESYGTTRAAGVSRRLWQRHGVALSGVLLISAVLDFQTIRFATNNDLPHMLFLPTYAATAHFHGRLGAREQGMPLEELLEEVEAFALGDYALALLKGARVSEREKRDIAAGMSRYIGLPEELLLRAELRPGMSLFTKHLRMDEGLTVGRLDSRFTGSDRKDVGDSFEYDPSYSAILGNYTAGLNSLVREKLGYETPLPYEILTGKVWPWDYSARASNRYLDVAEDLRAAMHQQPHMKVFVASGHYDLATPYFAADYTIDHMSLDGRLTGNITVEYYDAGHMMYVAENELEKLKSDLRRFYAQN